MRTVYVVLAAAALTAFAAPEASAQWELPGRQFHNATSFPLEGRHQSVACESCHLRGVYKGTPTRCFDCHWERRQDDKYRLQLGSQCEQCHRPTAWTSARWDHGVNTGMPLNAAHRVIACESCHKASSFKATGGASCFTCHQKEYQAAQAPNHVAAGFPTACEACHRASDTSFRGATFDHAASFPLVGVHATQTCASCHRGNVYRGTPRECVGCHRAAYERTTSPNHAAAGFPTTCESCHRETDGSWRGAGFDHNSFFQLQGRHAAAMCASCHQNNVYRGTARDCVGCHRSAYDRTTAPNHAAAGFPTTCEACHRASDPSWTGAGFDHNAIFQLQGRHATTACASCHRNNVYRGTPRDCVGCHREAYDRTTAPAHAAAGFPTTCESCHRASDSSWRGASFNHNSFFTLEGRHASATCAACHRNNVYRGTPRSCSGCHIDAYNRTTNPNHAAAGFPTTCESCHRASDTSWTQGTFNHRFPITSGPHRQSCTTCHTNSGSFQTFTCLVCHEHNRTKMDDKHKSISGYRYDSLACYSCHPNGKH